MKVLKYALIILLGSSVHSILAMNALKAKQNAVAEKKQEESSKITLSDTEINKLVEDMFEGWKTALSIMPAYASQGPGMILEKAFVELLRIDDLMKGTKLTKDFWGFSALDEKKARQYSQETLKKLSKAIAQYGINNIVTEDVVKDFNETNNYILSEVRKYAGEKLAPPPAPKKEESKPTPPKEEKLASETLSKEEIDRVEKEIKQNFETNWKNNWLSSLGARRSPGLDANVSRLTYYIGEVLFLFASNNDLDPQIKKMYYNALLREYKTLDRAVQLKLEDRMKDLAETVGEKWN